jgi:hypothetical protein
MIDLGLLEFLTLVLAFSLFLLRRSPAQSEEKLAREERAGGALLLKFLSEIRWRAERRH